jgi:CysZ protein
LLKEIVIAVQSWAEAHRFIQEHRLFRWIIIPGIIYTLLFILGMLVFWQSSDGVISWISSQLNIESWLQKERSEWLSFLFVMMGMMLRLVMVLFYFSLFKYLILIIGSPVFAYLSEKTEAIIEEKEHHFNWSDLKKDCIRNIKMSLRNCGWQSVYLLTLILLSLIPVIGWITPVIALLMECYYFGFSMLDYSFARVKFTPSQSITFTGRHKGLAIGNGLLFYIMHIVIVLAPAYAIIAATLSVHKVKNS